jgi:hypothetical protein
MNPRLRFVLGLDEMTLGFLSHPIFIRADVVSLCPVDQEEYLSEESIRTLSTWPRLGSVRMVHLWRVLEPASIRELFPPTVILNMSAP